MTPDYQKNHSGWTCKGRVCANQSNNPTWEREREREREHVLQGQCDFTLTFEFVRVCCRAPYFYFIVSTAHFFLARHPPLTLHSASMCWTTAHSVSHPAGSCNWLQLTRNWMKLCLTSAFTGELPLTLSVFCFDPRSTRRTWCARS